MAPELVHHDYHDSNYGRGLERFFLDKEVRTWYRENSLPGVITADYLEENEVQEKVIAVLRSAARLQLFEGMRVEEPRRVMKELCPGLLSPGYSYEEYTDSHNTLNHVLPIHTDKGDIEIVCNNAWGVGWRLGGNHYLGDRYPQLRKLQNPDTIQDERMGKSGILFPCEEIVEITRRRLMNAKELFEKTKRFVDALTISGDFEIRENVMIRFGSKDFVGKSFYGFSVENRVGESEERTVELGFYIDDVWGIKQVEISALGEKTELERLASELSREEAKFYRGF